MAYKKSDINLDKCDYMQALVDAHTLLVYREAPHLQNKTAACAVSTGLPIFRHPSCMRQSYRTDNNSGV